jgi:hypothetical protein
MQRSERRHSSSSRSSRAPALPRNCSSKSSSSKAPVRRLSKTGLTRGHAAIDARAAATRAAARAVAGPDRQNHLPAAAAAGAVFCCSASQQQLQPPQQLPQQHGSRAPSQQQPQQQQQQGSRAPSQQQAQQPPLEQHLRRLASRAGQCSVWYALLQYTMLVRASHVLAAPLGQRVKAGMLDTRDIVRRSDGAHRHLTASHSKALAALALEAGLAGGPASSVRCDAYTVKWQKRDKVSRAPLLSVPLSAAPSPSTLEDCQSSPGLWRPSNGRAGCACEAAAAARDRARASAGPEARLPRRRCVVQAQPTPRRGRFVCNG